MPGFIFVHAALVRVERVVVVKLLAAKLAGETRLFAALVLEMGGQVTTVLVALFADGARVPRTQHLVHQHYKKFCVKNFISSFEFVMHPVYISMPYVDKLEQYSVEKYLYYIKRLHILNSYNRYKKITLNY